MRIALAAIVGLMLAACAGTAPPAPATGQAFTGEVWGWDQQSGMVTLRQGPNLIHVKTTPDTIAGLRLHQVATVRGEFVPGDIERTVLPPGQLVARGQALSAESTGTVARVEPTGTVTVDSARGPVTVWIATPGTQPFKAGQPVRVRVNLQPLEVLPPAPGATTPAAPTDPPAPTGSEPGEYAVVRGRITAVDPAGRLTVDSARGPVTVLLPAGATLRTGDWIDVQTSVHPTR
jgi:hypothetical protein